METNEIMNNEVIETTEEIVKTTSGKVLKCVSEIGLVVACGFVAYKYIAKPIVNKLKTKKEEKTIYEAEAEVMKGDSKDNDK